MPEQNQRPERFRLTYKMGAEPRPTDAEVTQDGYVIVSALETISAQIEYLTRVLEQEQDRFVPGLIGKKD